MLDGLYRIGPYRMFKITMRPKYSTVWLFVGSKTDAQKVVVRMEKQLEAVVRMREVFTF